MDDVPNAQHREDDDLDEDWSVVGKNVKLGLPPEIALSLSGSNPQWTSTPGKRSRDILTTSSAKVSKINEQPTDENSPIRMTMYPLSQPMITRPRRIRALMNLVCQSAIGRIF